MGTSIFENIIVTNVIVPRLFTKTILQELPAEKSDETFENMRTFKSWQVLKMVLEGALKKIIIGRNYLPKTLQYVWQGSKYRRAFEYTRFLNMPRIEKVLNMCEYTLK